MTNDIRNARINRKLKTNPELRRLAEDLTNAQEVATFAHEQMNPLQEMTAGLFGVLAGDAVSANALFADYVGRVIAGEAMGDLTDPARAILGHNDAREIGRAHV